MNAYRRLTPIAAVLFCLGSLPFVIPCGPGPASGGRLKTCLYLLKEIRNALDLYWVEREAFPASLDGLTDPELDSGARLDEIPLDPWNEEFVYRPDRDEDGRPTYVLRSKGPDRIDATPDDVTLSPPLPRGPE